VIVNSSKGSDTVISACRNLNLGTAQTASSNQIEWDANNYRKNAGSTDVSSQISGAGVTNNVNVTEGQNSAIVDEGHPHTDCSAFMSSKTTTTRDHHQRHIADVIGLGR
jgi:filamentous hemagglutinin